MGKSSLADISSLRDSAPNKAQQPAGPKRPAADGQRRWAAAMPLDDTLFIGWHGRDKPRFALDTLLQRHDAVRDAVATLVHREFSVAPTLWPQVVTLSFTYAFNAYKALGHILPHRYHEAASTILRQVWEVSLNLHWMEQDPEPRARDFCGFTIMEMRKQMALAVAGAGGKQSPHRAVGEASEDRETPMDAPAVARRVRPRARDTARRRWFDVAAPADAPDLECARRRRVERADEVARAGLLVGWPRRR